METRQDRYDGMREKKLERLRNLIEESDNIVFLGGAGVSTESGIPDFRSGEGIFNQESGLKYRAVDVVSHSFFEEHKEEFFDFYKRKLCYPEAKPNKAHKALVRLEKQGKLKAIVTQNIDCLHQMAGSKNTIELHGSVYSNYCMECGKKFKLDYVLAADGIPYCNRCGGVVRPDVTLYEENLKHDKVDAAIKAIKKADLLIIGGTSLTVYPAATFVQFLKNDKVVIINKSSTHLDLSAMLTIHDSIGEVLDTVIPKRRPSTAKGKKTTGSSKKSTTSTKKSTASSASGKTKSSKSSTSKASASKSSSNTASTKSASASSKKETSSSAVTKKPAKKTASK